MTVEERLELAAAYAADMFTCPTMMWMAERQAYKQELECERALPGRGGAAFRLALHKALAK